MHGGRPLTLTLLGLALVALPVFASAENAPIRYAALGDSITAGQFASKTDLPRVPLPFFPSGGTSYTSLVAGALAKKGAVIFTNLAQPGSYTLSVWNQQVPRIPRDTTLVTIFIGLTDETLIASNGRTVEEGVVFQVTLAFWRQAIAHVIAGVRLVAPKARIVLANVPNLGQYPAYQAGGAAPQPDDVRARNASASEGMDQFINSFFAKGIDVVDLRCDPRIYAKDKFANEIHPNDNGYAVIAEDFLAVIAHPHALPPHKKCPPYSVAQ
jgi:lysophospholipase L1-like esterase